MGNFGRQSYLNQVKYSYWGFLVLNRGRHSGRSGRRPDKGRFFLGSGSGIKNLRQQTIVLMDVACFIEYSYKN